MNMMFVGPKVSMGYRPGMIYDLKTGLTNLGGKPMILAGVPGMQMVPYETVNSFLRNWRPV